MKINFVEKIIGSFFFTGFSKYASGTVASGVAYVLFLIPGFENPFFMIVLISLATVYGIMIGRKFENAYGKDPGQFTLDEFVGSWISLLFIPKIYYYVLPAFIVWRIFDILKPFPARLSEKISGGLGIMLDDIIAGFYSLIVIHIVVYFS